MLSSKPKSIGQGIVIRSGSAHMLCIALTLFAFGCSDDTEDVGEASDGGGDVSLDASGDIDEPQDAGLDTSDAPDDTAPADASDADGGGEDAGGRSNPDVELIREITFEQPPGTNGWTNSDSVIFNWQQAATGRDYVPDAMVRVAGGINIPELTNVLTYRGNGAALFTMEPWGGSSSTFRTDAEIIGDLNAVPPVSRLFRQGETHVVGFAMRIEHATYLAGGFQLMHQYHNGSTVKAGYGSSNNPAVALQRSSDTDLGVAIRSNGPGDDRPETYMPIAGGVRAGQWVRWVFKTRFANYDSGENGLIEVYSAVGSEPLVQHFRVDDRPMGYTYADPAHNYEVVIFDLYGSPLQADGQVYLDEIRIAEGDVEPSVVDPIEWVSYQHPLNQPYDTDLATHP